VLDLDSTSANLFDTAQLVKTGHFKALAGFADWPKLDTGSGTHIRSVAEQLCQRADRALWPQAIVFGDKLLLVKPDPDPQRSAETRESRIRAAEEDWKKSQFTSPLMDLRRKIHDLALEAADLLETAEQQLELQNEGKK
jgi:hypothetical protein